MMTAPVEHVELPVQKKKKSGGLIIAAVALVAALAAGALMLSGNKSKPQMQAPETEVPVITTESPELTAPVETTEATEPLPVWYDNVLMAYIPDFNNINTGNTNNEPVFGTNIIRAQVKTITFRDSTAGAPTSAYDVSEAQDGSVLLWCKDDALYMKDIVIAADGGINAKNTANMFRFYTSLESVDFGNAFHTDEATDISGMFHRCDKLKELDLSELNTGNVTKMNSMFAECANLTYVNMNSWNTSKITDMSYMFWQCDNMGDLEIKDWNITYVTSYDIFLNKVKTINGKPWEEFFMYRDFRFENDEANAEKPWADNILMAQKLPESDYHGPNPNVPAFGTNIARGSIQSVTFLDSLSGAPAETWDVSAAQDGGVLAWATLDSATGKYDFYIAGEGGVRAGQCVGLFAEFTSLKTVSFGTAFHVEGIKHIGNMFAACDKVDADMSHFNIAGVTDLSGMFSGMAGLTKLDLSGWDVSNVTDMSGMFSSCENLTELNLSGWDVSNVTDMSGMFHYCRNLKDLDISGWETSNVANMDAMFSYCYALTDLDLSGWDTSNVTSMHGMFDYCSGLTKLNLTGWDTSNVTDMGEMFSSCNSMVRMDLSHFDTSSVTNMGWMFSHNESLREVIISGWDTSKVTSMQCMFAISPAFESVDFSEFETDSLITVYGMFDGSAVKNLDIANWDTSILQDYEFFMNWDSTINGRPWTEFFQ